MRDITEKTYKAIVIDGDEKHVLFYRRPGQKEIASYNAHLFERRGNRIIQKASETRTRYGAKIMTGFEKGTFGVDGKVFASQPEDPDYRADWKELLVEHVPDIVAAVGAFAFEGTKVVAETPDFELGDEDEDPDPTTESK
ncbi:MAG: hypothetical protein LLG06_04595 [Desulfobacteraceae bacterium]|nr:hypothetical protein [Desulfobacteraceae bacterium]